MPNTRGFDDLLVAVIRFFRLASPLAFGIGLDLSMVLNVGWLFLGGRATRQLRINAARRTAHAERWQSCPPRRLGENHKFLVGEAGGGAAGAIEGEGAR